MTDDIRLQLQQLGLTDEDILARMTDKVIILAFKLTLAKLLESNDLTADQVKQFESAPQDLAGAQEVIRNILATPERQEVFGQSVAQVLRELSE